MNKIAKRRKGNSKSDNNSRIWDDIIDKNDFMEMKMTSRSKWHHRYNEIFQIIGRYLVTWNAQFYGGKKKVHVFWRLVLLFGENPQTVA